MSATQYRRACTLSVVDERGRGLDLSALRVVFVVSRSDTETPNTCNLRVYNLAPETARRIEKEFTRVRLSAGYVGAEAVIFDGNIVRTATGREGGVDTFLGIDAADGDKAYNYAVVNATLAAGATPRAQLATVARAMNGDGVTLGPVEGLEGERLPRGKVLFGTARDSARQVSESAGANWSIQNGKIQAVSKSGYLPGAAVVLNSKTGLIGTPEQTNEGIKARCLLNPQLVIGGRVRIAQGDVQAVKLTPEDRKAPENRPPAIEPDGFYRVLAVTYLGDTRGNDWYSDLVCVGIDASAPAKSSVKALD